MSRSVLLAAALAIPLAACGRGQVDRISYSVEVDGARGTAAFTCKDSSSGKCVFRFDDPGAQPQSLTVTKGEVATVTSIGAGSTYCMTTGARGAACKAESLQAGTQTIRREKHGTS
ncbi:hypothetical protein GCM10009087_52950 [Sphingomonas oligophenolica]|uniref:DUF4156 domain-containing protein n=1 Tax=Sphingomonas oligophenolica TaxID=301154 RepID=A0ABU9Y7G6_9SPHN